MTEPITLETCLEKAAAGRGATAGAVAETVLALAGAGRRIAALLAAGPLAGDLAATRGDTRHGDTQKELDLRADALVLDALRAAPVAVAASEETDAPVPLAPGTPLAVAIDPLDGSSNIDTLAPVGTIFSILPVPDAARGGTPEAALLQPGHAQLAAGFLIYGPRTVLALTLGDGTRLFTLDAARGFVATDGPAAIALEAREYAINGSNQRHWDEPTRRYVRDCQIGAEGPRGRDFNTRWIASMVAEAYRILVRGGVYLYPADARPDYRQGRLRLTYEANPVALLIEQAGGAATDGERRILDLRPESLHQRVPLVFGAAAEVAHIAALRARHAGDADLLARSTADIAPLFARRGLFRASDSEFGAPECP